MSLRKDAEIIIQKAIERVLPDEAVASALKQADFGNGKVIVVAAGKAAWQMAKAASDILQERIDAGIVITKYDHVKGEIPHMRCFEAGHPVPDENSFHATEAALEAVSALNREDTVLFLVSGGGSALFEKPLIDAKELAHITQQLLACGADIKEINTIRKRLSAVKGGKFAQLCAPAHVFSIVLSDILGDPLDMIASGPAYPDSSTCQKAKEIAAKYHLELSDDATALLDIETPKELKNVTTKITGSVSELCKAASDAAKELGYEPIFLSDQLECEAKEAGAFLSAIAKSHQNTSKSLAFIAGGETVVHLKGNGKGGRNQELVLSSTKGLGSCTDTALFSIGSDGTDGPTDAAGGYADHTTLHALSEKGIDLYSVLQNNDAYHALKAVNGLIITGPTGTNVNDVTVVLIKR